ncbi:MAG: MerR family transcriptional regulator [Lachnospiraceae bacterium]|nr:MerR family transcriptional regulator [Lachnospiraceae bacterium]
MSEYTTGEIAKLCGVTVRTVQYYDTRGLLVPSKLSEGGRRLYSEEDLKMMQIICFLRELGLPIDSITQLLSEPDSSSVILLLLDQQEKELRDKISKDQTKLNKLEELKRGLKDVENISVESIGDIAYIMENKKKLKKVRMVILGVGIPINVIEIAAIVLWIVKGIWLPFVLWLVMDIVFGVWISRYYYRRVAYICPQCHEVFKPAFKQMFWARHTPNTRKLTCTNCGHHGFCVEIYGGNISA